MISYNFKTGLLEVPPMPPAALSSPTHEADARPWKLEPGARPAHETGGRSCARGLFRDRSRGNVKEQGVAAIARHGPYELRGDTAIMRLLDRLLSAFWSSSRE